MFPIYIITLYIISLIGGSTPLWYKRWNGKSSDLLLAFSGTFLLGITIMHLIPENVFHSGKYATILIALGFILQLLIQKLTHGLEHGHVHLDHQHQGGASLQWGLIIGLGIHAFSEGIPLGIDYHDNGVLPALFFAVAIHKIPEAMLLTAVFLNNKYSRTKTITLVALFSLITPVAIALTKWVDLSVGNIQNIFEWCLPLVSGSFLQISTTILYESGTKHHEIKSSKWLAIIIGFSIAVLSSFFITTHRH